MQVEVVRRACSIFLQQQQLGGGVERRIIEGKKKKKGIIIILIVIIIVRAPIIRRTTHLTYLLSLLCIYLLSNNLINLIICFYFNLTLYQKRSGTYTTKYHLVIRIGRWWTLTCCYRASWMNEDGSSRFFLKTCLRRVGRKVGTDLKYFRVNCSYQLNSTFLLIEVINQSKIRITLTYYVLEASYLKHTLWQWKGDLSMSTLTHWQLLYYSVFFS